MIKTVRMILPVFTFCAFLVLGSAALSFAQGQGEISAGTDSMRAQEDLVRMNQSLKNLIEQNQQLLKQNEDLQKKFEFLRSERIDRDERMHVLEVQKENILKKSQETNALKNSYAKEIRNLKIELDEVKQKEFNEDAATEAAPVPAAENAGDKGPMLSQLVSENQDLRKQAAKLHSNLGNLFLEQGRHDAAAEEFAQVTSLMPDDAVAHYNLALMYDEYLKDPKAALAHYRKYLELAPDAADAKRVKNKIFELEQNEKSRIDFVAGEEAVSGGGK